MSKTDWAFVVAQIVGYSLTAWTALHTGVNMRTCILVLLIGNFINIAHIVASHMEIKDTRDIVKAQERAVRDLLDKL